MVNITQQVQAASSAQPDWLQKKRQLASMLLTRFSNEDLGADWVAAWQQQPQLEWLHESAEESTGTVFNQPLDQATVSYPALCQENLMEKGLFWQDKQINALHLALLNGGRLIYLPDQTRPDRPLKLQGTITASNYHTLLIAGANSVLQLQDQRQFVSGQPGMMGLEILLGRNARVQYQWDAKCQMAATYFGLGFYQAQDSSLMLTLAGQNGLRSVVDLKDELDGQESRVQLTIGGLAHQSMLRSQIDSGGASSKAKLLTLAADKKFQCNDHFRS